MRGRLEQRLTNFSGGIRRADATTTGRSGKFGAPGTAGGKAPGSKTKREELQDGADVIYDRRTGLLRRRDTNTSLDGTDLNSLAVTITSMMPASGLPAGAANQVLFSNGASIWRFDPAGGLVGAPIFAGLTANSLWHHVVAPQSGGQGPIYMMNGTQARYWTGAAGGNWTAAAGTLPIGRFLLTAGTGPRTWVANIVSGPAPADPKSALAWSDPADSRSWPAANLTMFDPNDGDELMGLGRIGPYIAVFKRRKTWLIYDLDTSANRQISSAIGCISHRSIVETPHGLIFMSERGPAIFDGSTIKMIEDKLNLISYLDLTLSRDALCLQVNGASTGDDYYVNGGITQHTGPFPTFYTQNNLAHYDILNDAWWLHTCPMVQMGVWNGHNGVNELWGIDANALVNAVGGQELVRMFAVKGSDGLTDEISGGTRSLTARFRIVDLDFGTDRRKYLRSITLEGNAKLSLSAYADGVGFFGAARDLTSLTGLQRSTWPRPAGMPPAQRIGIEFDYAGGAGIVNPPPFEIAALTLHGDVRAR